MASVATTSVEPGPRRWTRAEFYRLADLGLFAGQRVELIDGDVMVLGPQEFGHYAAVDRVAELLRAAFGPGYWVRTQAPMNFGACSEPEPDVSVVAGRREDFTDHPATAVLVVEVSDSTLAYDRNRKASLYATAGIQDYWIVNLVGGQLEVRRSPVADAAQDFGFGYSHRMNLPPAASVSPLPLPSAALAVSALLSG